MRLYICGIKDFLDLNGTQFVTGSRLKRIHCFRQNTDKARALVSGLLLRRFCGVVDDCDLIYGDNGKPYLKNNSMFFNISHSGDYVVLVTADNETGVDIEIVKPFPESVAGRFFTPEENEYINAENTSEAFFRIWTAKESIMKGSGLGLSMSPESFSVLPMDSSAHVIDNRTWFLEWFSFNNHIICRSIENKNEETEIIHCTKEMVLADT